VTRQADPRISIAIADDHPIFRRGLRSLVEPEYDIVAEAESGHAILDIAPSLACRVVILDLAMPGAGGLAVLKELRRVRPDLPVLVLSASPEDQHAYRCIKAGASGYLTKSSAADELLDAIKRVAAGGLYVSAAIGRRLTGDALRPAMRAGARANQLSDREFEVLCLLVAGESVTAIGRRLHLSVKTISTYRRRVLTKLDMPNLAALVRYAVETGLIAP